MKYKMLDASLYVSNRKNFMSQMDQGTWAVFNSNDIFNKTTLIGLGCLLIVQSYINLGVTINILPSTGDGEGGGIDIIKGNMPTNEKVAQIQQISHPDPTENVSTYYYVQPYETIQNQIVTFPIPVSNKSMSRGRNELNPLWEM